MWLSIQLKQRQTLIISLSETQFYIQNIQEPIAPQAKIVFQNIPFVTTAIGIYALAFQIIHLTLVPLYQRILKEVGNGCKNKDAQRTF